MRAPVLLASALFASAALAQAPVIEISGANFRPLPLAYPAPYSDPSLKSAAAEVDDALWFDLAAAGVFDLLDRKSFLAGAKEGLAAEGIQFSRWADVGAEALVKVQLARGEGDQLKAELHLYSVGPAREDLKLSESGKPDELRQVAHRLADGLYRSFTHEPSPFLSRIAYVKKAGNSREVWLSDWDGKNGRALATGGLNLLPAVTPDGRGAAFTSYRRGNPDLWVQELGAGARPLVQQGKMATGVAFSPDGKRIAYALAEDDSTQIWVANADGSSPKRLTDTPYVINSSPTWAPDGKRLAFVSSRGGSPQVYWMNADGSSPQRLTFQGNYNQTPRWSPRGDLIAFTARDERNAFDLFTYNVETGKIARLTQDAGSNSEPSFSPNGRLVVFVSNRNGAPQLFVMTYDGRNQVPLKLDKGNYDTPSWGPAPRN